MKRRRRIAAVAELSWDKLKASRQPPVRLSVHLYFIFLSFKCIPVIYGFVYKFFVCIFKGLFYFILVLTVKNTDKSVPSRRMTRHSIWFLLGKMRCDLIWLEVLFVWVSLGWLVPEFVFRPLRRLRNRNIFLCPLDSFEFDSLLWLFSIFISFQKIAQIIRVNMNRMRFAV